MTLFDFFYKFTIFVELIIPFIPIFWGLKNWNKMSIALKLILVFIIVDWLIYWSSFYLYDLAQNNLFLHYFHSFFSNLLILLSFHNLFKSRIEKKTVTILIILNTIIIVLDYIYFKENKDFNFLSGGWIDLTIFIVSTYYFTVNFISVEKKNNHFHTDNLLISLTLSLQFLIKLIDVFMRFLLKVG